MKKKPLTVAEFASMGGKARARKHTKKELSKWGRKAARARWREAKNR